MFKEEIFPWMREHKMWVKVTRLETSHNNTIVWLQNADPKRLNINSIYKSIRDRIKNHTPFQLTTKRISNPSTQKLTSVVSIQCSVNHASHL